MHANGPALEAVCQKSDSMLIPFHTVLEQTFTNLFIRMLVPTVMYTLPFHLPVSFDALVIHSSAFKT